jgi:hypothetical protein
MYGQIGHLKNSPHHSAQPNGRSSVLLPEIVWLDRPSPDDE